jgi:hypothetical protein
MAPLWNQCYASSRANKREHDFRSWHFSDMRGRANEIHYLRQGRHGRCAHRLRNSSGTDMGLPSRIQRRVRIQDARLPAAKVSNPRFRGKARNSPTFQRVFLDRECASSNPPRSARHSAFERISFFSSRKARQWRAFLTVESLLLRHFRTFSAKTPESFQPISIKFPFSGDSPWRR